MCRWHKRQWTRTSERDQSDHKLLSSQWIHWYRTEIDQSSPQLRISWPSAFARTAHPMKPNLHTEANHQWLCPAGVEDIPWKLSRCRLQYWHQSKKFLIKEPCLIVLKSTFMFSRPASSQDFKCIKTQRAADTGVNTEQDLQLHWTTQVSYLLMNCEKKSEHNPCQGR